MRTRRAKRRIYLLLLPIALACAVAMFSALILWVYATFPVEKPPEHFIVAVVFGISAISAIACYWIVYRASLHITNNIVEEIARAESNYNTKLSLQQLRWELEMICNEHEAAPAYTSFDDDMDWYQVHKTNLIRVAHIKASMCEHGQQFNPAVTYLEQSYGILRKSVVLPLGRMLFQNSIFLDLLRRLAEAPMQQLLIKNSIDKAYGKLQTALALLQSGNEGPSSRRNSDVQASG